MTNSIAAPTVAVGETQEGSFVMTSDTFVMRGSWPTASTLLNASLSVKVPIIGAAHRRVPLARPTVVQRRDEALAVGL